MSIRLSQPVMKLHCCWPLFVGQVVHALFIGPKYYTSSDGSTKLRSWLIADTVSLDAKC